MICIFEKFFIRFTDFIIGILITLSDILLSVFDKENNQNNVDDLNDYGGYDGLKFNGYNKEDIFEDSGESFQEVSISENFLSISKFNLFAILGNDDIFEELENRYLNNQNFINQGFNEDGGDKGYDIDFKTKMIAFLLNNKFYKIQSSQDLFKLVFFIFLIIILISLLINFLMSLELSLIFLISFLLIAFSIVYLPKIKKQNDYYSISKELPYALRQLSTELKAGKSLFDAIGSVVVSDYGVLSIEFSRVLEEIKYGESSEDAFLNLEKRVPSKALSRVIYEILASLRIGSNLSNSLSIIAEDVNFDMRMKLKEYSEKLNAFIMIYTFLAILAPVIVLTMLLAASVVIGDLVPGDFVLLLYALFFPMIIVFLAFSIKKLEPKL